MTRLMRFPTAAHRDPSVESWLRAHSGVLGAIACRWFEFMRGCGDDVRELIHDGQPTACVGDAAFAYVDVFKAHVNVGFYLGVSLSDPANLLQGTGRFMRHVKLGPGREVDEAALADLITEAYSDMGRRIEDGSANDASGAGDDSSRTGGRHSDARSPQPRSTRH
ncbi:MAG: DUF1801 domain-containing protein [Myxococcota bacterium]